MLLILNLVKPNEKGGNAMASQILVTSNSEDRLNQMIPYIEKIATRAVVVCAYNLSLIFLYGRFCVDATGFQPARNP